MKHFLLSWVFVFSFFLTHSQELTQTIKGRIVDEQSKSTVIGATVLVVGSDPILGGVTDVEGYFKIPNVPIGRHTLKITSVGYESATLSEMSVTSGKELILNVDLKESILQMNEVIVTANDQEKGQPKNELASVSSISLTVEETSRYAATFDDPARAVLTYAGVTTGGDDLLNEIVVRGNSPKGLLWRMEGVEIPNPNHFSDTGSSAGGISMLSSNMLSNSDFFTGAFTPQYGNATSGIFDLKLRKGNYEKSEHTIQAGLLGVAVSSEGPINKEIKSTYLVNYRYSTLALLENIGLNILSDQEKITFQDVSFKVHLPTEKAGSFSIWGLGGRNTYTFRPDLELGETLYEDELRNMGVAGVTNVYFFNENTFIESVLSASISTNENLYDSLRQLVIEKEDIYESAIRFSSFVNHKFNARHTLRVGGIYSRLGYDLYDQHWITSEDRFINDVDDEGHAGFIQGYVNWQTRPTENLTINTGIHTSHFTLNNKSYVEPRLGFRLKLGRQYLTGGAGMHSRKETTALYSARQEMEDGSFEQMNKDLGFTRAAHFVLGFEKQLNQNLRFKAEAYYQHLYDVPVWPNDTSSQDYNLTFSALNTYEGFTDDELANDGKGKNYGLELTLEKFFTNNYYFLTTASLYESKYRGSDGVKRDTRFNGGFVFNIIGGKEFKVGRTGNNTLGLNGKFIFAGGKRQAPVDLTSSIAEGYNVYNFERNFELLLTNYYRFDIGIDYRKNKGNSSQVLSINVQNVTAVSNEFDRYYSEFTGTVISEKQLSFFPNLSYRWEF
ncbi:MAG: TonB-dependent receptor [Cytophagales bacterium]|nr:TonB-dependent receptor [Cytophagales bacterium]